MGPFTRVIEGPAPVGSPTATLTHDQRRRARLRVTLAGGEAVAIALRRGVVLLDGDVLADDAGRRLVVRAAQESVSVASTPDPHLLARAAYHLGNRHAALQIEPGRLIYPHDHVLDAMCRDLGLEVREARACFEPEAGGYASGHGHGQHAHGDAHE